MNLKLSILIIFLFIGWLSVLGQSEKNFIREGNKLYENDKFIDSEINYRKSLEKNAGSIEGTFNLGDALYKQGKYEEAAQQFKSITDNEKLNKDILAKAYHNLGNSLLKERKFEESINAFKKALKSQPNDIDTKYNLAYAQAMLRQQQQQNNNKKEDQKDQQQDSKQEQKDKNQNSDQQKNDQQDPTDNQNKDEQDQQNQQANKKEQKISKEDAQRILEALNNKEKDTQKKLAKKPVTKIKVEKDW